jgi:hypothetical protein
MAELQNEGYLNHLEDIHNKIVDFIDLVNHGKTSYLIDIALKLRLLYMDKSGSPALIKKIQEIYNIEIVVWVRPTIVELIESGELHESLRPSIYFHNPVTRWLDKGREKQNLFSAFQKESQVIINEYSFSVKKIIEVVADKMGGAHIDQKVADKDLILHNDDVLLANLNFANRTIYDTAITTLEIIKLLLDKIKFEKNSEFIIEN